MLGKHHKKHIGLFLVLILSLSMVGCYRRIPEPAPQGPDDEVVEAVRQFNESVQNRRYDLLQKQIEALGASGDPRAVEPLVAILEYRKWVFLRLEAVEALGKLGDPRAVEPLSRMLRDPVTAWVAAKALAKIDESSAVPHLIEVLEEGHWKSKASVAWGSRFFKDPRIVNALIDCLNDQRWEVRSNAAGSLGEINDLAAIYPLIDLLDDDKWQVRLSAARSLGNFNDGRAIKPLIDAMKNEWGERYKIRTGRFLSGDFFARGFPIDAYKPPSITAKSMIDLYYRIGRQVNHTSSFLIEKYALLRIIDHNEDNAREQLLDLCKNGDDLTIAATYDILISIGEKGTEPMLIQALQSHGDAKMAHDFTTCGNPKLEMAGAVWIDKNRWKEQVKAVLGAMALGATEAGMTAGQRELLRSQTSLTESQINAQIEYQRYLNKKIQSNNMPKKTQVLIHPIWGEID